MHFVYRKGKFANRPENDVKIKSCSMRDSRVACEIHLIAARTKLIAAISSNVLCNTPGLPLQGINTVVSHVT